eukprot:6485107-Amphidinium_carterae.1
MQPFGIAQSPRLVRISHSMSSKPSSSGAASLPLSANPEDDLEHEILGEGLDGSTHIVLNGDALRAMTMAHVQYVNTIALWRLRPKPLVFDSSPENDAIWGGDIGVARTIAWLRAERTHQTWTPPLYTDNDAPSFTAGATPCRHARSNPSSWMGYGPSLSNSSMKGDSPGVLSYQELVTAHDCLSFLLPDLDYLCSDGFGTASHASLDSDTALSELSQVARPVHSISTTPTSSMGYNPFSPSSSMERNVSLREHSLCGSSYGSVVEPSCSSPVGNLAPVAREVALALAFLPSTSGPPCSFAPR